MLQRKRFASLEEYDSFCFKLSDILYDPTKLSISTGDDAVLDDVFSYQVYNLNKNNWRASARPTDAQSGMVMSDLDDDKLYHRGAALADEEVLQLTRSHDVDPQFATVKLKDTGADHYLQLKCNENLTANRILNLILGDSDRTLSFPLSLFPEGSIIAWIGGYFTNGANAGYTRVLGSANTVAAVNTLLNASGWYVCDGAALNLATSTIFNGAGRYLPNLTDDRFIMGDNAAGGSGGSSTMAHTHGIGSYVSANESAHTHAKGTIATGNESAHTHAKGSYAVGSHYHVVPVASIGATNLIYVGEFAVPGLESLYCESHVRFTCVSHTDHGPGTHSWIKSQSVTPSFGGTSAAGSVHNHSVSGSTAAGSAHNHSISGSTAVGSAHSHSLSGTSAAASNTENRPLFLSCFYLMYALA